MKTVRYFLLAASLLLLVFTTYHPHPTHSLSNSSEESLDKKNVPSEHFFLQRAYPDSTFDLAGYEQAMVMARRGQGIFTSNRGNTNEWVQQGPGNIGGRINAVAIHPTHPDTMYVGSASGGVHKTTDGGQTWTPIFDDFAYLAIGAIALDPSNPEVVYVGTGDPNITGYPFIGDGVYKSIDGGQTWTHLGLEDQRIVSRIIVDPTDSATLYVATMGLPFVRNNDRGLYKSIDGGQTWSQVLFISNQAGVIDLVMDPFNPDVLYATSWDRIRTNQESVVNGQGAGIWKSVDGGNNWTLLGGGLPSLPQGRMGLAISQLTPGLIYSIVVGTNSQAEGIYKSTNGGQNWTNITGNLDPNALGGFGWYFGQIRVSPNNDDELWILGIQLFRTQNGGGNWNMADPDWWLYEVHADKHDLQFAPNGDIFLTTDGGMYKSTNNSATWTDVENIPNTQFYRVAINPHNTTTFYGGTQDNGSISGNASTLNSWQRIFGGDGFQMRFDPNQPNIFYAETQNGGLYYTFDSGNNWAGHSQGLSGRRNWDMPFMLSSHNPMRQYTGTYQMYRVENGGGMTWNPISPDLTDGVIFGSSFHTISAMDESPLDENVLYTGTTDGNVWVSTDYGTNWNNITQPLPDRYVTSIIASPVDSSTAFVAHSGYKYNDFFPHIHKTTDYGASWIDISGDLPPLAINDICVYPADENVLFVATDGGVYSTQNGGNNWTRVGNNMPMVIVYDLEIEPTTQTLVAGTHGRSLMTYDLGQILPPAQPVITVSGVLEFCEGDSVTLSAPVGFAGYLWSTGDTSQQITVTQSGSFQVEVVNTAGTSSPLSAATTVTVYPNPPQPLISGPTEVCEGDSIVLQGPVGYATYYWNGQVGMANLTVKDSGSYVLQVETAEGCLSEVSETVAINISPLPLAEFSITALSDSTLSFSNLSQNGDTYLWDFGDGMSSTDANPTHAYAAGAVDLTISLIVNNACGTDTFTTYYAGTVNLPEEITDKQLIVSPIPAHNFLWIHIPEQEKAPVKVAVWDVSGRKVLAETFTEAKGKISVSSLSNGSYVLSVQVGETRHSQRILIRH